MFSDITSIDSIGGGCLRSWVECQENEEKRTETSKVNLLDGGEVNMFGVNFTKISWRAGANLVNLLGAYLGA